MSQVDIPFLRDHLLSGNVKLVFDKINRIEAGTLSLQEKLSIIAMKLYIYRLRGWLQEGLKTLERELSGNELSAHQKLLVQNLKSRFLLNLGEKKEAFKLIDQISTEISQMGNEDKEAFGQIIVYNRILKSLYYYHTHDYKLALNYAKEAYHLLEEYTDEFNRLTLYSHWIKIYLALGEIQKSFKISDEYLASIPNDKFLLLRIFGLVDRASIYISNSQLDNALNLVNEATLLSKKIESPELDWHITNTHAMVYRYKGDPESTKSLHHANLEIAKELKSKPMIAASYNNLGITFNSVGEFDQALEHLFLSLDIYEVLNNKDSIGSSYNNLAIIYIMKGELDLALEFLTNSKEIAEEVGSEKSRATAYVNLGQVYHMKGFYQKAAEYYYKCLEIDEHYGNDVNLSESLYNLLTLYVELDKIEKAKEYLSKLEAINTRLDNKIINLRFRLGRMQILKSSKRALQKAKAQEILLNIVEEDPIDFELYVSSLLNLCEILMVELKQTGEDEVLKEIKEYVNRLHDYATSQQSYMYMAESFLIKSKIAQLELNFSKAKEFIEQAEQVSLNKGLDKLAIKISSHYDNLLEQMESMDTLYESKSSIKERLEQVKLEELFIRMINTKTEELQTTPENPTMFLIIQEGGTTIYRHIFNKTTGVNEELVSGLFSALYTISDEVFNTKASTQRIKHEDYTIIMKPLEGDFIFCYVFEGESFNALRKLDMVVNSIKDSRTIWNALSREIGHFTQMEKQGMQLIVDSIFNSN